MYGNFTWIEANGATEEATRIFIESGHARDEIWLRDLLFDHPGLLPIGELDPAFSPLVPLCKELRTDVGSIDAAFINRNGRLTIVECKLWKNPQARREVVAQILDYVSAISSWTYADLQRQVAAATGQHGNLPYAKASSSGGESLREPEFIDAVNRNLRAGRILALIVGDGIRDDVQRLAETINRHGAKAFSLGLVEVALYETTKRQLIVQPRILARTETIMRELTLIAGGDIVTAAAEGIAAEDAASTEGPVANGKLHLKDWWRPVLEMKFDDPEQEAPFWVGTNNVVLKTPFPGILIKSFALVNGTTTAVFLTGRRASDVEAITSFIRRDRASLERELPPGTEIDSYARWPITTTETEIENDDERRAWIVATLNRYVNILRPRLRRWHAASSPR